MRKAVIRQSDPTTTGGFILTASSTIKDDGRKVALSDDEATCGKCDGTFKILGTGNGIKERGRVVVIDGDVVLCPCQRNRVLAGRNPGIFLKRESGSNNVQTAKPVVGVSAFDQQVVLRSPTSGDPLVGVRYRARSASGQIFEGVTDFIGRTERIKTSAAEKLEFEIALSHTQ
jgi:uncharacterized Zn-binding protein involved in type VI secretion